MSRAERRRQKKIAASAARRLPPAERAFQEGAGHFQAGRFGKAADAFAVVVRVEPENVDALNNLGLSLLRAEAPGEALGAFEKSSALTPDAPDIRFNIATAHDAMGHYPDAEAAYRKVIELAPDYVMAHGNLAGVYMEMSRQRDALACFESIRALDPGFPGLDFRMGLAYQELEEFEVAIRFYKSVTARADTPVREMAGAYANIGYCLKMLDRNDEAANAYIEAVALSPDDASIAANLGDCYLKLGKVDAAQEVADGVLSRRPGDITMLAFKAAVLNEAGNAEDLAHLADFARVVRPMRIDVPDGYAELAAFNESLSGFVLTHPSLVIAPSSYSTMNGRHTGELMERPKGPMRDFVRVIDAMVARYRKEVPEDAAHPWLAQRPTKTKLVGWSVVMDRQGHQLSHIHPGGWLSGVYYPKLPDVIDDADPSHEGWIEFGRTNDHYYASRAPETHLIKPEEGLMVLFPSYFYHRTIPFGSDQHRISIAFDVIPLG